MTNHEVKLSISRTRNVDDIAGRDWQDLGLPVGMGYAHVVTGGETGWMF